MKDSTARELNRQSRLALSVGSVAAFAEKKGFAISRAALEQGPHATKVARNFPLSHHAVHSVAVPLDPQVMKQDENVGG